MRWRKGGLCLRAEGQGGWMQSHAQIPTALVLEDRIRVYFASRPRRDLSLTTFVDLDRDDPSRVLALHEQPILEPGPPGAFDEHGIMPSCAHEHEGRVWLWYGGWSRRVSIPYANWTGLAWSEDGGRTFRKAFPGPVFDRTPREIWSATAVFVLPGDGRWDALYASGRGWIEVDGRREEVYRLRHAVSADGLRWERHDRELLPSRRQHEPTHRPTVLAEDGVWHLWFCHRGIRDFRGGADAYRIGYARSTDLEAWERDDEAAGIDVSPGSWDATMLAYPYVVRVGERVLLFYCGDGFGESGFGWAELVEA